MGVADVFPLECLDRRGGATRTDSLSPSKKLRDGMFDSSASFGAGDNEGVLADAQGASGYIVCIHQLGLGGRDEADFAVRAILGKDA